MKILYYESRKMDPICWDASTVEKEEAALQCLFTLFEAWQFYSGLEEVDEGLLLAKNDLLELESKPLPSNHPLFHEAERKKAELQEAISAFKKYSEQAFWLKLAREDNGVAVKNLLFARKDYEYEDWTFLEVCDPLEESELIKLRKEKEEEKKNKTI